MAVNAGMQRVDLYAFFCPECSGNSPAGDAMASLVNSIQNAGVQFGTLWIDVGNS